MPAPLGDVQPHMSAAPGIPPSVSSPRAPSRWQALLRLPLHLPRLAWRVLLVLFFVLGVAFMLLRHVGAPQIAAHRGEIEQALSQALGLEVRIARLEANWDGLRPELAMSSLQLIDRAGRVALELPQVNVAVAWSSLWHFGLRLHRLEILRPELAIRREADGQLFVAGLKIESSGGESGFGDFVLEQDQILIRDARLVWTDAQRAAPPLALDKVNLRLENSGRRHRFALLASPPAAYSANLDLRGDLRGRSLNALADWRGELYLSLDQADLAVWQQWTDYPLHLPRGRGGLRAWASFEDRQLTGFTADVALADLSLRLSKDAPQLELAALQGRLKMTRDEGAIALAAENLSVAAQDGIRIGPTRLALRYQPAEGKRPARGEFSTEQQDVQVLARLAGFLPLPEEARQRLALADPGGRVEEVALSWEGDADKLARFKLSARVEDLHLHPVGNIPGFAGVSGQFGGTERGGDFSLRVKDGGLYLPAYMHEPFIALQRAELRGSWGYEAAGKKAEALTVRLSRAQVVNGDVTAEVSGLWQAREQGPGYLDLRAQAAQARLDAVWRYIPAVAPLEVVSWLRQSLSAGRGENLRFQLTGELDHFPFTRHPGVFKLESRLRDAQLETFAPGWPGMTALQGSFVLDRQRMTILAESGRYGAATARAVKVEIPDLMAHGQQVLTVEGRASGPNTDFLRYVNASFLHQLAGDFTGEIRAQGSGELKLALEVPLHDSQHTRVRGDYSFKAPSLRLTPALPDFTDASATLGFTERGLSLPAATAQFLGRRVRASGVTEADGSLRFDAQGNLSVSGLRQLVANPAWDYLGGESPVALVLRVRGGLLDLTADSSLAGVTSSLPAPFAKDSGEAWPLRFSLRQTRSELKGPLKQVWQVNLGPRLDLLWAEQCAAGCKQSGGALAIGEAAVLPAQGWRFSGIVKELDVGRWKPVVDDILSGFGEGGSGLAVGVAVRVGELNAGGFRFRDLAGKALRRGSDWSLLLDGPDLAGELSWSELGEGRLRARLSRLTLTPPEGGFEASAEDTPPPAGPQRPLPALDVVAEQFQLRKMKLGQLSLLARNEGLRWKLDNIALKAPDLDLKGQGEWLRAGREAGTRLDFKLHSEDVGTLLARLGHADTVRRGTADFEGSLSWRGLPTSPHYPSLSGRLKLDAADGQFRTMEPGAGRLLGILSLQSLPRRITLDFRDVFSEGFAFDRISGDMTVAAGLLHTNDLEVRGPAARVFITGATDLGREQHDLRLKIQPTLSESVAVGALAIGALNPVVGAATYVAQKLLRDPVEKIFSYEYVVRGPWADPKIEKAGESGITASAPVSEE